MMRGVNQAETAIAPIYRRGKPRHGRPCNLGDTQPASCRVKSWTPRLEGAVKVVLSTSIDPGLLSHDNVEKLKQLGEPQVPRK